MGPAGVGFAAQPDLSPVLEGKQRRRGKRGQEEPNCRALRRSKPASQISERREDQRTLRRCLPVSRKVARHLAANDVMKGHAQYCNLVHSSEELNSECPPEEEWPTFVKKIASRLLRYATTMNAESHNLIVKHLCHLPTFFNQRCTRRIIVSGFNTAAIYPFNPSKMLARCDSWDDFNQEEQLKMITAIPQLSLLVEQGTCTDDRMF